MPSYPTDNEKYVFNVKENINYIFNSLCETVRARDASQINAHVDTIILIDSRLIT